jgi:molybdopterin-dependent oxidoreductase alpha subunit
MKRTPSIPGAELSARVATGHPLVPADEAESPRIGPVARGAGGMGSLIATARYTLPEAGLLRTVSTLARLNQVNGFDCPGCAWPEPADPSFAEFCENGAKHVADEATTARVDAAFFARHPVEEIATWSDLRINKLGRLVEPMIRREGATHYEPIGWDAAFELIGSTLRSLPDPDRAVFYTSGRTSNEAAFLYQAFVRAFGTNNLPDCSNMCHESSGWALHRAVGVGKGTVSLADFDEAEVIVVVGQNPGTNHPRMLSALQSAARRGARIVAVNPLREAGLVRFAHPKEPLAVATGGTELASHYLQVRIGGDNALCKAIGRHLLELHAAGQPCIDEEFVAGHTDGFEAWRDDTLRYSLDALCEEAGLEPGPVCEVAELIGRSQRVIYCWAMGLTQHEHATSAILEWVNLALLRGHIGRPGAGLCPVRGHSNVQGDRTMGIYEKPSEAFLAGLDATLGFTSPRAHGYDVVDSIKAMHDGRVDVFVALGGNFVSAAPDTSFTAEAMQRCSLTVQVSTKLNRSHLVTGRTALILPCLGRTEIDRRAAGPQQVTVEDSMSMVHATRGHLEPASPMLLSEPAIVARMAESTLAGRTPVRWAWLADDYRRIRALIEQAIPGFEAFEARLSQPGGFRLPNAAADRRWNTQSGRAAFTVHPLPRFDLEPGELLLMTTRSHDQFNTTVYGLDDRYRGVRRGRYVLFMHPDDIAALGFMAGHKVDVVHDRNGRRRVAPGFVIVPFDIPRGNVAGYYPELNPVVPIERAARHSGTPVSKSVPVRLERAR